MSIVSILPEEAGEIRHLLSIQARDRLISRTAYTLAEDMDIHDYYTDQCRNNEWWKES